MEFITSTYRQQGGNTSAFLLQQCDCRKMPVLFACLCSEENKESDGSAADYVAECLRAWFRTGNFRRAAACPEKYLWRKRRELQCLVRRTDAELMESGKIDEEAEVSFAGIFCIGSECLLFGRGSVQLRLLNRNMGRACAETPVQWEDDFLVRQGVMEPEVGLLLATEDFFEKTDGQPLREGLFVEEVRTGRQAERHLWELGNLAERAGGRNMGAVICFALEGQEGE